jgi:hypothetical protein
MQPRARFRPVPAACASLQRRRGGRIVAPLALAALLAGCAGPRIAIETQESFDSNGTFSRTYAAIEAQTCEAARRALLSQGFVIGTATAEQVRGRKSFQPGLDAHAEVEFTVVCAREGTAGYRTIAFVNAVQESYSLKKSNNSASVGVAPFGSLSLPFTGSDESLVRVGSATITSAKFYDRFFNLLERYLAGDAGQPMPPSATPSAALALPMRASPTPVKGFIAAP